MKIDSAVRVFTEKYDTQAMRSIDEVSKEFGLNINGHNIKLFNMNESFDLFRRYLRGYSDYKINNIENEKASPHSAICEAVDRFIDTQLFHEKDIKYCDLPAFVKGYVEGVSQLLGDIDHLKEAMMEAGVDLDEVGSVNDFVDKFMESLDAAFDPAMDKILWASGYNAQKALYGKKETPKVPAVSFI